MFAFPASSTWSECWSSPTSEIAYSSSTSGCRCCTAPRRILATSHLCGYTCATLADLGRQAGLFLSSLAIKDRWLFDATFRKVHGIDDLTNREFVVHQYVTVLERVPDIGGLTHWISRIDEGAASRAEITRAFQSARFKES